MRAGKHFAYRTSPTLLPCSRSLPSGAARRLPELEFSHASSALRMAEFANNPSTSLATKSSYSAAFDTLQRSLLRFGLSAFNYGSSGS